MLHLSGALGGALAIPIARLASAARLGAGLRTATQRAASTASISNKRPNLGRTLSEKDKKKLAAEIEAGGDKWKLGNAPGVTPLHDDPYGWDLEGRWPREAPLWMVYEAERDEVLLPKEEEARPEKRRRGKGLMNLPMRDVTGRAVATGRRKTAVANVYVMLGSGNITVNRKTFPAYFERILDRHHALEPLLVTQTLGAFDFTIHVRGGGLSGQSGAIRHGIARAIARFDPYLKPILLQHSFLLRDPRMVERKKPGQLKARRKFQWVKR